MIAFLPLARTTVLITNGKAQCKRGRIRSTLLDELEEVARMNGITDACIHASQRGGSIHNNMRSA